MHRHLLDGTVGAGIGFAVAFFKFHSMAECIIVAGIGFGLGVVLGRRAMRRIASWL